MKPIKQIFLATILLFFGFGVKDVNALPQKEDTPEEILRTEIITNGRSPLDNKPLSAAEYQELQAQLAEGKYPPQLNSEIRSAVFLLELLKFFKIITPF